MIKFGIGQAVRRVEDRRFLTGQGRYVDDITLPGICHGVNVLSPHAHAHIKKVDRKSTRLNSSHVRISYAVFCFLALRPPMHLSPTTHQCGPRAYSLAVGSTGLSDGMWT